MTQGPGHHKGIARLAIVAVLLTLSLLLLGGCSSQDVAEKVVNKALEKEGVKIDVDDETGTIETPEGKVTVGEELELPEGFPKTVPVYPKSKITSVTSQSENHFLTAESQASLKDVIKYYKAEMKKNDWKLNQEVQGSGESSGALMAFSNGVQAASITIGDMSEGKVSIAISIGPDESAPTTTTTP